MKSSMLFLFNLFQLISLSAFSQIPRMKFTHLKPEDGLSHTRVWKIVQDKQGFIWFATDYGLNKFDGYKFKVYKNAEKDPNSLATNFIWDMQLDKDGNLWIATNGGGLDFFDVKKETFTHHKHDKKNPSSIIENEVRTIYIDKKGLIWVGCGINGGLYDCFDRSTQKFTHFKLPIEKSDAQRRANYITEDDKGCLWFGLSSGDFIFVLDRKTNKFTTYKHNPNDEATVPTGRLNKIYIDKNKKVWVATSTFLSSIDEKTGKFTRYKNDSLDNKRYYDDLAEDDNGNLWLSSNYGLCFFDTKTQQFTNLHSDPNNSNSLLSDNVGHLFFDKTGILWANIMWKGIDKLDKNAFKFRHYRHDGAFKNSITDNVVRNFHFDKDNTLWLSLMNSGVDKLVDHQKLEHFDGNASDKNALNENPVIAIYTDSHGAIWVGNQHYGLNKLEYNSTTKKYTNTKYRCEMKDLSKYSFPNVKAIIEDKTGNLWVGSEIGIDRYNRKHDSFTHYSPNKNDPQGLTDGRIQFFFLDSKGFLWIGTWEGLLRSTVPTDKWIRNEDDVENKKFERFITIKNDPSDSLSISGDKVISMCEDKNGTLWFGTYGNGLNKLLPSTRGENDPHKFKFQHYNEESGLPNSVICGVYCDEDGNLWMSTNSGLAKLNLKTEKVRTFTEKDGLQGDQFLLGSCGQSKTGEIYFGGMNGYNAFFPKEIKDNKIIPTVVITNLKINNEEVHVANEKEKTPLKESISLCKELFLSYRQNSFSFEFTAIHYTAPENNQYAYQLVGFDKTWIKTDSKRRFANYTNIDAGTYYFKVKASNSDGVWNEVGASIKIVVRPPFWLTWWFEVLVLLSLAYTVVVIVKVRINKLKKRQVRLEKLVAIRTQEIKQKNAVLEQQKEEIVAQRDELDLKNKKIEAQTDLIKGSIRYAKSIQSASFPPIEAIERYFKSFIIFKPKDIVSGDFYWFNSLVINDIETEKEYTFAAVVDCTGHGVPGAFMSMLGSSLLKEIILQRHTTDPAIVLNRLEQEVIFSLHQGETRNNDGMDVCLCRLEKLDDETYELVYAGAKRPLIYFSKESKEVKRITGTRRSIGGFREHKKEIAFENNQLKLKKGDFIILTTDGYQDQPDPQRKRIGTNKLESIITENSDKSIVEIQSALSAYLDELLKNVDQRDDITIVGIEL